MEFRNWGLILSLLIRGFSDYIVVAALVLLRHRAMSFIPMKTTDSCIRPYFYARIFLVDICGPLSSFGAIVLLRRSK